MEAVSTTRHPADEVKVREILAEMTLPPEISTIAVELKNDSAGDLALYLSFQVKADTILDRENIARLSRFMSSVLDKLLRSGISLFPYGSLDQAA